MSHVLKAIGFKVYFVLAKVLISREHTFQTMPYYTHAVLLVTIEGKTYLVETGFDAKSPRFPIPIDFT